MDFPNLLMASPLFNRLQGLRVSRVTWNGPATAFVFDERRAQEVLLLHLHQDVQAFHLDTTLHPEFEHIQFQDRRHDFSFLPPHLEGATLLGGSAIMGQSLLCLEFHHRGNFKEDGRLRLFIEHFGGGRAVLTDAAGKVIRASRKGGEHHRPGSIYEPGLIEVADFRQELPMSPACFSDWPEVLLERVRQGGQGHLPSALFQGIRGFKPDSVRYLIQRKRAHQGEDPTLVLARRLGRWVNKVCHQRERIHVLSFPPELHRGCQIFPFPMKDPESLALLGVALQASSFDDYVTALNHMGRGCMARFQMIELAQVLSRRLDQRLARERRLLGKLEKDWERAAGAEDKRHQADSLAAHLSEVSRGMDGIELEDVHEGHRRLSIPLDPSKSPQDNLNRLYKQAAKGERGLQTIELRMEEVRRRIIDDEELLNERLPALANCNCRNAGEIMALRVALLKLGHDTSLMEVRKPAKGGDPQAAPRPYRRYNLPGDWEVFVGRNNRENDRLTHKEASGRDLWFHAAGTAGSHVILRTGGHKSGVPKSIIEAAASIAAFHSKARHSKLVPVIYTEKRYVRKPRKGAPGLALCSREKTIFVSPELPMIQNPGS